MKIILSRKGFDSASGGYASPVLPSGELLSLPIPDVYSNATYNSLKTASGQSYREVMKHLKDVITVNKKRHHLTENTTCHLDPDLYTQAVPRYKGWRGALGQSHAAQIHLENNGVGEGDLFLFFGWFRSTSYKNGQLHFDSSDKEGRHIIFGYLQVGQIVKPCKTLSIPQWLSSHPHLHQERLKDDTNTIYVAMEAASWDSAVPGYGTFNYNPSLVLTKEGCTRSRWKLPEFFRNVDITYHNPESWKTGYFQSAGRGQEFVITENEDVTRWAKQLIAENKRNVANTVG